ncbi:unnamed protein product [Effrenium voratum]|nr:unnamed protein product [Effrenium voratum]
MRLWSFGFFALLAAERLPLDEELGSSLVQQASVPEVKRKAQPGNPGGGCDLPPGKICFIVRDHYGFEHPLVASPKVHSVTRAALKLLQKQGAAPRHKDGHKVTVENMKELAQLTPIFRYVDEELGDSDLQDLLEENPRVNKLVVDWRPLEGETRSPPRARELDFDDDVNQLAARDRFGARLEGAAFDGLQAPDLSGFADLTSKSPELWQCLSSPEQYRLSRMLSVAGNVPELPESVWRDYLQPALAPVRVWAALSVRETMHGHRTVLVDVGRSSASKKCVAVHAGNLSCLENAAAKGEHGHRWKGADEGTGTFHVAVANEEVCVQRTDCTDCGWDFEMGIRCHDTYKEYVIPVGKRDPYTSLHDKHCVTVHAVDLICHEDAANPEHRINQDPLPETFQVSVEGDDICVQRTDRNHSWDMDLRIACFAKSLTLDVTALPDVAWKNMVIDTLWGHVHNVVGVGMDAGRCIYDHVLHPIKAPLTKTFKKVLKMVDQLLMWSLDQLGFLVAQALRALAERMEKQAAEESMAWLPGQLVSEHCFRKIQKHKHASESMQAANRDALHITATAVSRTVDVLFDKSWSSAVHPLMNMASAGLQSLEGIAWLEGCGAIPLGDVICALVTSLVSGALRFAVPTLTHFAGELLAALTSGITQSTGFLQRAGAGEDVTSYASELLEAFLQDYSWAN